MPKPHPSLTTDDARALAAAGSERERATEALKHLVLDILGREAGSVRDIAACAGISTNTVSRWKRGE